MPPDLCSQWPRGGFRRPFISPWLSWEATPGTVGSALSVCLASLLFLRQVVPAAVGPGRRPGPVPSSPSVPELRKLHDLQFEERMKRMTVYAGGKSYSSGSLGCAPWEPNLPGELA